ncbi:MAG: glycosyltransferase family 2 protein [Ignavibacteria bacterium]|nr:glycosyltransferase family 2 protein [Ignavibacteria bacterium]
MNKGISIVVCCHNSSALLEQTLKHICRLKSDSGIKWEVIIIDNASTDDTFKKSEKLLKEFNCPVSFKIISEPEPGLSNARKTGMDNSEYEYILFCDDDNWLEENYLITGFEILDSDEKIGALGGKSEAVTETEIPDWFEKHSINYSVGKQSDIQGDISNTNTVLWGAGMFVRKSALIELYSKGFYSFLTDRKGNQLSSGGDSEKCYALRLAGWKIWYDERLKLKHFIQDKRLTWDYLRKLSRGFGAQKIDFDPYLNVLEKRNNTDSDNKWHIQALRLIGKLRGYGLRKLISFNNSPAGDNETLRIEKTIGRLKELLKIRSEYNRRIQIVETAKWRK